MKFNIYTALLLCSINEVRPFEKVDVPSNCLLWNPGCGMNDCVLQKPGGQPDPSKCKQPANVS